jgi:hypothetical protein
MHIWSESAFTGIRALNIPQQGPLNLEGPMLLMVITSEITTLVREERYQAEDRISR